MKAIVIVGALLAGVLSAQTPITSQILRITRKSPAQVEYTNLGQKGISAVIFKRVPQLPGNDAAAMTQNYGGMDWRNTEVLKAGESRSYYLSDTGAKSEVAALIFEDGSVIGEAKSSSGVDYVQAFFAARQAEADAWKGFRESLGPSPSIEAFINAARAMQPGTHDAVRSAVADKASEMETDIRDHVYTPQQALDVVLKWMAERTNEMAGLAHRSVR